MRRQELWDSFTAEQPVYVCRKKSCKRYGIGVVQIGATKRKYCTECGAKLKQFCGSSDTPPLIEYFDRKDKSNMEQNNPTGVDQKLLAGGNYNKNDKGEPHPLTWPQFNAGPRERYDEYLKKFAAGDPIALYLPLSCNRFHDLRNLFPIPADAQSDAWRPHYTHGPDGRTYNGATYHDGSRNTKETDRTDTFRVVSDEIEGCPIIKQSRPSILVRMPMQMYASWIWLCLRKNTEWIAYLKGTQDADTKQWTLTDMYFPKQKANGAHVDAGDNEVREGTIGSVHSHVGMNAFFSQEDKNHFNHPVEIVVNRKGEIATSVRLQLDCGKWARLEDKTVFLFDDDGGAFDRLDAALEAQLTQEVSQTVVTNYKQ